MRLLKVAGWITAGFVGLTILGMLLPGKPPKPEKLAIGIIGCKRLEPAVAIARTLSSRSRSSNTRELEVFAEHNGCSLIPAGNYVTPIEEEVGHQQITKASVNGTDVYLLGLPRPTSEDRLHAAVADLKDSVGDLRR